MRNRTPRGVRPILLLVPALAGAGLLVFADSAADAGEKVVGEEIEEALRLLEPIGPDPGSQNPVEASLGRLTFIPVQAQPLIDLLHAVQANDPGALPSLFAPELHPRIEKKGWAHYVKSVEAIMVYLYGTADPDAFTYIYRGDSHQGRVQILTPDGGSGKMDVIFLDGRWLINEP